MYKAEVITDSSGKWCGNGLRFDTAEKARDYVIDLACRRTSVRGWRVVDKDGGTVYEATNA